MVVGAFLNPLPPFSCPMRLSLGTGSGIYVVALGTGLCRTKSWEVGGVGPFLHVQSDCGAAM